MNKAELIDAIAADAGISKAQAKVALDSVTNNIGGALAKGGKVSLVGFGTFSVSVRVKAATHKLARPSKSPPRRLLSSRLALSWLANSNAQIT